MREGDQNAGGLLCLVFLFALAIIITAGLANQCRLTLRTGDGHVGLVDADVGRAAARPERLSAGLAVKRLFAKAAFDHVPPSTASPLPRREQANIFTLLAGRSRRKKNQELWPENNRRFFPVFTSVRRARCVLSGMSGPAAPLPIALRTGCGPVSSVADQVKGHHENRSGY